MGFTAHDGVSAPGPVRQRPEANKQVPAGRCYGGAGRRSGQLRASATHESRGGGAGMSAADVVIVGGGIVGLATAYQLTRRDPPPCVVVLEKEAELAGHQTGHNSGVIHSGVYYKPGSLKAATCRAGKKALEALCAAEEIPYEICGKVIVAVTDADLPALQRIYERGRA